MNILCNLMIRYYSIISSVFDVILTSLCYFYYVLYMTPGFPVPFGAILCTVSMILPHLSVLFNQYEKLTNKSATKKVKISSEFLLTIRNKEFQNSKMGLDVFKLSCFAKTGQHPRLILSPVLAL
jgi:hypothetical protein